MVAVGDPGMTSVMTYVGSLPEGESSIDPGILYKRLVGEYEQVAHTNVFASGVSGRGDLEPEIFSTIAGDFLHDYKKITDVDVIVADFGARVIEKRNQIVRSIVTDFFSQLAATAEAVQGDERSAAQFTPAFRASLTNLNVALENGEFKGELLDGLLAIKRLSFNPNVRFMGEGLITMIGWETADGTAKPVYPAGFEEMLGEVGDLNPSVWGRALRAVLVAMRIHEGLTVEGRMVETNAMDGETELFTFARQAELSHTEGKAIIIPVDDERELNEMEVSLIEYLSYRNPHANAGELFEDATVSARSRSLLLLLDEGLVDDAKSLLQLRQDTVDSSVLGLLIHAYAAHGHLTGIRRELFVAALKFLMLNKTAELEETKSSLLGKTSYHLIPLLDFEMKEQRIQDRATDMHAYLTDYYRRKPHTNSSPGGAIGPAPRSGSSAPRTPGTPSPAARGAAPVSGATPASTVSGLVEDTGETSGGANIEGAAHVHPATRGTTGRTQRRFGHTQLAGARTAIRSAPVRTIFAPHARPTVLAR